MQTTEQGVLALAKAKGDIALASYHFTACIIACSHTTVKRFFSLGEFAQRTPQRSLIPTWHYSLEPELLVPEPRARLPRKSFGLDSVRDVGSCRGTAEKCGCKGTASTAVRSAA